MSLSKGIDQPSKLKTLMQTNISFAGNAAALMARNATERFVSTQRSRVD
jgi:hypothetical protein